jgi:hypothetical protein
LSTATFAPFFLLYHIHQPLETNRTHIAMAHPLLWPPKTFFYPVGNTSAVCLTQDLAPEQTADVLLLGCGDPRNILYTVYSDLKLGGVY